MKKIISIFVIVILMVVGVTACENSNTLEEISKEEKSDNFNKNKEYSDSEVGVIKVDSNKAKALIKDEAAILVDVRTQEEYDERHIEGSMLIPLDELETLISQKIQDKNANIILYCRSGRRSSIAGQQLISMGYTNVYDLGAISSWEE